MYDEWDETRQQRQRKELEIQRLQPNHELLKEDLEQAKQIIWEQINENKQQTEQRLTRMCKRLALEEEKKLSEEEKDQFKAWMRE